MTEFEELITRAQEGEEYAREHLVKENMGLVYSVAKRFGNRGFEMEELVAIGMEGLLKAILRFDIRLSLCFSTYAVPMIMGEIRRMIRDSGSIRVSRSLKERAYKTMQVRERLCNELGREPSIEEIARMLSLKEEEVVECLDAMTSPVSLSEVIYEKDQDSLCLEDQMRDKKQREEIWVDRLAVEEAMEQLTERERKVIILKYYMGKTQGEIAGNINLSQAQVSRIEKNALTIMREYLAN